MAHIEKRGENSWRLTVYVGTDAKGKRIPERRTVKVEDPALLRAPKRLRDYLEQELAKFKIEIEAGAYIAPEKMKFAAFTEEWVKKFAAGHYSPRTLENYTSRITTDLLPEFGHMSLEKIKPMHVLSFINDLPNRRKHGNKPLSGSTILFIYKVLHAIMKKAVEWQLIPSNPVDAVSQPKVEKKKAQVYGEDEAVRVIAALYSLPELWRLYFLGAMMGGFRRGELLAVELADIDFEREAIFIHQSISWTEKGQASLKGTKTDSEEWVDMPSWYMRDLKKFVTQWKQERLAIEDDMWQGGKHQYVFHGGLGKPFHHDTPTGTWRKFLKRNNLRHIRLHDLRHTAATLLVEDGVDLKLIQERLRHTKFEVTADLYAHVTKKAKRGVASRLEKFDPGALGADWEQNSSERTQNNLYRFEPRAKKS